MVLGTIEGMFENGAIRLQGDPPTTENAPVLVTFLSPNHAVGLDARNIPPAQAADLRARLASFEEDWNRSEMDAYDAL